MILIPQYFPQNTITLFQLVVLGIILGNFTSAFADTYPNDSLLNIIHHPSYSEEDFQEKADALVLWNTQLDSFDYSLYHLLLKQASTHDKPIGKAYVTYKYLNYLLDQQQFEEALTIGKEVLQRTDNLPIELKFQFFNLVGVAYHALGDYPTGNEYLLSAIQMAKVHDQGHLAVAPLANLFRLFYKLGNYKKAVEFGKQSLELTPQLTGEDQHSSLSYNSVRMSQALYKLGKEAEAKTYAKSAAHYGRLLSNRIEKMFGICWYLEFLSKTGELQEAERILVEVDSLMDLQLVPNQWINDFYYLAKTSYFMAQDEYPKALKTIQAHRIDPSDPYFLEFVCLKKELFQQLGDQEGLNQINEVLITHLEARVKEGSERQFSWMENQLETLQIIRENNALKEDLREQQEDIRQQKTIILTVSAILALFLIIGIVLGYFLRKVKYLNYQLQEKNTFIVQKSNELEQLTYSTTHDIKEPVNNVLSFSKLLANRYQNTLPLEAQSLVKVIEESSSHLMEVVSGLHLYLTVGKSSSYEKVCIHEALSSAFSNLGSQIADYKAQIDVEKMPIVDGKKVELVQLFQNLISNAICYSKPNSIPHIRVKYHDTSDYHQFSITDNGIGIAQEYHQKIFDLFQILNGNKAIVGKGIGLANVKKIVEQHRGSVWVDSQLGQGSTFHFTLKKAL
ncbi:MAG: ATP-binding protein [Bacteroidota bacterium]